VSGAQGEPGASRDPLAAGDPLSAGTEVLVEVTRGPEVESIHRGAFAVCDPAGQPAAFAGDPRLATYLRSAVKPFQALALYESGAMERFAIPREELAIVIASHGGEPFHVDLVRSLMQRTGVREEWLRCGAHPPYDVVARTAMTRAGASPTVLHNNCSGKHVGMLAAALASGAPVETYVDPAHPVQAATRRRLALVGGLAPEEIGVAVDGCSAPTFRMPLASFATALAHLAAAGAGGGPDLVPGLAAAWTAMVEHPQVIAGTHERLDTDLMIAAREAGIPLIAKAGAEGTYGIAVLSPSRGPLGIAVKMEDGGERGRNAVSCEILDQLGLLAESMRGPLEPYHRPALRNRSGLPVGEIRPSFRLRSS
jgi:L-asparaginase II